MKYCLSILFTLAFFHPHIHATSVAVNELVYKIRDPKTSRQEFRKSLKKIGEYIAIDVLNDLNKKQEAVETVLGATAVHTVSDETPVLITILRAGVPLYLGALTVFPEAESGFLGMARNEETLEAKTDYIAIPPIADKTVIIIDTMIATGGSIVDAIKIIEKHKPKKIIVMGALAALPGVANIHAYNPEIAVYVAAVDPALNEKGYIVPGLGDAGDRCYGSKCTNSN